MKWGKVSNATHSEREREGKKFTTRIPDTWERPKLPDTAGSMARKMARNKNRSFMAGRSQEEEVTVLPGMEIEFSAAGMSLAFIGRAVGSEL